jgi:bacteriocin-like protein
MRLLQEAGFDVSKADWLKYQANQTLQLSDEELENVSGGTIIYSLIGPGCTASTTAWSLGDFEGKCKKKGR